MKRQMLGTMGALCSVPFVMVLSNSMLIPVLPAMQTAMNLTLFKVGLIITAFSIPAGLFIPLGGYLSDQFGRKAIMAPALFLFGLGGLLAGIAPFFSVNPYMLILGARALQGLGAGGTYQVAMAATGDIFQTQERSKALGLLEASNGLGKVISPILGSAVALIVWFAPFYVYPALAWPSAAGVWFLSKEAPKDKRQSAKPGTYLPGLKKVIKDKGKPLAGGFLVGMLVLFMLFGFLSWYSDVLENSYGLVGIPKGLVIAIPVLVMASTSYLTGTVAQKQLAKVLRPAVLVGVGLIAVALAGTFFVSNIYAVTAFAAGLGLGNGFALPAINMIVTSSVETARRGIVTALYGTVRFFGAALGPPAFGLMIGMGKGLLFLGASGVTIAIGIAAALLLRKSDLIPQELAGGSRGSGESGERSGD